jgi:hypothetical protein
MLIRDRIVELRRVKATELRPSPRNWRTHPATQQDALRGVLAEVGYADALLARVTQNGELELIDGHLRAETTPEQLVPVLVLDVTDAEAAKLLVTLDPLAALAEANAEKLAALLDEVHTDNPAVAKMLADLKTDMETDTSAPAIEPREVEVPDSFQIVITCANEEEQRKLYERLTAEGYACKVITL